ncbi:DUF736 domain-containing protein (plasmid) [Aliirhizobium terrae]|uniref:hypothetical protein n=1 Tax=Terrirhizobium terrae TaxID=2926709 RepID=UPI0025757A0C|nr:hypothetical protein [Rhizobium sp. CC-CFT758]WJH38452.1 DUF736 domain-containing protein [Rhizobium sp. CC-CFT758]
MRYKAKPGDVSLFENEKAGHEGAPDHRGYFIAHRDIRAGEKVELVLWSGRPNSARSFGGRLSDGSNDKRISSPVRVDLFGNPLVDPPKR